RESASGVILNAGALTHTSVAILDALNAAEKPVIELHLSNVFRREKFRHHSYVSAAAQGVICGFGAKGYELAIEAMANILAGRGARWQRVKADRGRIGWADGHGCEGQRRRRSGPDPRSFRAS